MRCIACRQIDMYASPAEIGQPLSRHIGILPRSGLAGFPCSSVCRGPRTPLLALAGLGAEMTANRGGVMGGGQGRAMERCVNDGFSSNSVSVRIGPTAQKAVPKKSRVLLHTIGVPFPEKGPMTAPSKADLNARKGAAVRRSEKGAPALKLEPTS